MKLSGPEKVVLRAVQTYGAAQKTGDTNLIQAATAGLDQVVTSSPGDVVARVERWLKNQAKRNQSLSAVLAEMRQAPQNVEVHSTTTSPVASKYKLETYETPNGRGVRFTQPKRTTLLQIVKEINAESQSRFSRDAIYEAYLLKDNGMETPAEKEVIHDFLPVVKDSNDKTRSRQGTYLEEKGMSFVDRPAITVATGLFRLENGFPAENSDIGTSKDKGDLLQGQVVRAGVGALDSDAYGVRGKVVSDAFADGVVFAAGSPNHKP